MNANLPGLDFAVLLLILFSILLPLLRRQLSSLLLLFEILVSVTIDFLHYYHFHYLGNFSEFRESLLISMVEISQVNLFFQQILFVHFLPLYYRFYIQ